MIHPKVLYQFTEQAGRPFMPSNGTEGMTFAAAFCDYVRRYLAAWGWDVEVETEW